MLKKSSKTLGGSRAREYLMYQNSEGDRARPEIARKGTTF